MKKNIVTLIICMAIMQCALAQQLLSYSTGAQRASTEEPCPRRTVKTIDNGYEVTYTFDSALIVPDSETPGSEYWKIAGFGFNETPGEPAYLQRFDSFEIPNGSTPTVTIVSSQYKTFDGKVAPAKEPDIISENGIIRSTITPVPLLNKDYPYAIVEGNGKSQYLGQDLFSVRISPIQVNPYKNKVYVYTTITYQVTFPNNGQAFVRSKRISNNDPLYFNNNNTRNNRSLALNYEPANVSYLIITVPDFKEAVDDFISWKKNLGFNVNVIYNNIWTRNSIQSTINNYAFEHSDIKYVLFIGDHNNVPSCEISAEQLSHYDYLSDNSYFSNSSLTGIISGRMPASTVDEAKIMVNKAINYEKATKPYTSRYNRSIHCAQFEDKYSSVYNTQKDGIEDVRFTRTSEDIRNYAESNGMEISQIYGVDDNSISPRQWNKGKFANGGDIPINLCKPNYSWNVNFEIFKNPLNEGCSYILHSGHGNFNRWGVPNVTSSNILTLTNANKALPILINLNCLTGNYKYNNSLCKAFLANPNGGAALALGATKETYTGYNDAFAVGMFNAIWPEPGFLPNFGSSSTSSHISEVPSKLFSFGEIVQFGLKNMEHLFNWGSSAHSACCKHIRDAYHIFGDPSSLVYFGVPGKMVTPTIIRNTSQITVKYPAKMFIAFHNFKTGEVARYFGTECTFRTNESDNVNVSLCSAGCKPYLDYGKNWISRGEDPVNPPILGIQSAKSSPTGIVTVEIESEECNIEGYSLEIRNSYGTIIGSQATYDCNDYTFDISSQPHGIYLVTLSSNNSIISSKTVAK